MTGTLDLGAYLERIGWNGEARSDLATLAALLDAHMMRIPFENLDVLLGRGIRLDLDGLQRKLVDARRGGYCFEHATLFAAVLESLGFAPIRHAARVVLAAPRAAAPRTHMFLTVPVDGATYVVDPGFGSLAPRVPVPLADATGARGDTGTHWLARDGRYWALRTRKDDQVVDCWVSTLVDDNLVDFEMGNHYTATHPASPFVSRLMLRALTADGQVGVMNRDVTRWRDGVTTSSQLADRAALRSLLVESFGFDLPDVLRLSVPSIPEWN